MEKNIHFNKKKDQERSQPVKERCMKGRVWGVDMENIVDPFSHN